jgi:hypothetical protein
MQNLFIMIFYSLQIQAWFWLFKNATIQDWIIVDDVVMGGESSSTFQLNSEGHGFLKAIYP